MKRFQVTCNPKRMPSVIRLTSLVGVLGFAACLGTIDVVAQDLNDAEVDSVATASESQPESPSGASDSKSDQDGSTPEAPPTTKQDGLVPANDLGKESQSSEGYDDSLEVQGTSKSVRSELPKYSPLGQRLRILGVPQSQWVRLIPRSFEPVRIDELQRVLRNAQEQGVTQSPLNSATYRAQLVGGQLVSARSTLTITPSALPVVSLGSTNLAVETPFQSNEQSNAPRILFGIGGELRCQVNDGGPLELAWSRRGERIDGGMEFLIQIPSAPRIAFEIDAPENVRIESEDGVLESETDLPSGPAISDMDDAVFSDQSSLSLNSVDWENAGQWRRYRFQVGGQSSVRFRALFMGEDQGRPTAVIRSSQSQFELSTGGVAWNQRLSIETPPSFQFSGIRVPSGSIESVRINNVEVPHRSTMREDGSTLLAFDLPTSASVTDSLMDSIAVEIRGRMAPLTDDHSTALQLPTWPAATVLSATPNEQIQLRIQEPLGLNHCQFPPGWRLDQSQTTAESKVWQWTGPAMSDKEAIHLLVSVQGNVLNCKSSLSLQLGNTEHQAKARIECDVREGRYTPIEIRIQPGWIVESIAIPQSGRIIDGPELNGRQPTTTVWPEPTDLDGDRMVMEVTARTNRSQAGRTNSEPFWVARIADLPHDFAGVVTPPANMQWSDATSLLGNEEPFNALSIDRQAFLGNPTEDRLYFRNMQGQLPALKLNQPAVTVAANLDIDLDVRGKDVVETIRISVDSNVSRTPLEIDVDPKEDAPNYTWSIAGKEGEANVSLPSDFVDEINDANSKRIRLNAEDISLRGKTLIGKRRHALDQFPIRLRLPSIARARMQQSTVTLHPRLRRTDKTPAIQRVPVVSATHRASESAITRYRYDANDRPTMSIDIREQLPEQNRIWSEDILLVASSRGTDRIEARFLVTSFQPIVIDAPLDLQLASVSRNGVPIDLNGIGDSTGRANHSLRLDPGGQELAKEWVHVVWNRTRLGTRSTHLCRVPSIKIHGVVWRSSYRLKASAETLVPSVAIAGLRAGFSSQKQASDSLGVKVDEGDLVRVWRRDVVLGLTGCFAILWFAASWWMARYRMGWVVAVFLWMLSSLFLWPNYVAGLIAWLLLPTVCALLLQTSVRRWRKNRSTKSTDGSQEFSLGSRLGSASLIGFLMIHCPHDFGNAQESLPEVAGASTERAALADSMSNVVDVLVPFQNDGARLGNHVYVPSSSYRLWESLSEKAAAPQQHFESASYRIDLGSPDESGAVRQPTVEAEYVVSSEATFSQVRLPLDPKFIRRVKLVRADSTPIVRYQSAMEATGISDQTEVPLSTVVAIPPSQVARLLVTMEPTLSRVGQGRNLVLPIPAIASAIATVSPTTGVTNLQLNEAIGEVQESYSGLIRFAKIGPVDEINLSFDVGDETPTRIPRIGQQQYLIQADASEMVADYELTPVDADEVGDLVPLLISGTEIPTLISRSWQIRSSETQVGQRTLLQFERIYESNEPIRMTSVTCLDCPAEGEVDVDGAARSSVTRLSNSGQTSIPFRLPRFLSTNESNEPESVLIAIRESGGVQLSPEAGSNAILEDVETFYRQWSGYRSDIDRVLKFTGALPAWTLRRRESPPTIQEERHHLHVGLKEASLEERQANGASNRKRRVQGFACEAQLHYEAVLRLTDFASGQSSTPPPSITVSVPKGYSLRSVRINDVPVATRMLRDGSKRHHVVSDLPSRPAARLELWASKNVRRENLSIPRVDVWTGTFAGESSKKVVDVNPPLQGSAYVITHGPRIELVQSGSKKSIVPQASVLRPQEFLENRWHLFASWLANGRSSWPAFSQQLIRAKEFDQRVDCKTLTALTWEEGRWSVSTEMIFAEDPPLYVDTSIPSRWAGDLSVEGDFDTLQETSMDGDRIHVRMKTVDSNGVAVRRFRISGVLTSDEQVGVAVPDLVLTDLFVRDRFVSVPRRLTSDPIRWRNRGLQDTRIGPLSNLGFDMTTLSEHQAYRITSPTWSSELIAAPTRSGNARILHQDACFFLRPSSLLVESRLYVLPGSTDSLDLTLPANARLKLATTAGIPTETLWSIQSTGSPEDDRQGSEFASMGRLKVAFAYPQLPQVIHLILEYPNPNRRTIDIAKLVTRLPTFSASRIDNVPPTTNDNEPRLKAVPTWCSVYQQSNSEELLTRSDGMVAEVDPLTRQQAFVDLGGQRLDATQRDLIWRSDQQRRFELADHILKAIEGATDLLAERPLSEASAWMDVWSHEFEMLARPESVAGNVTNVASEQKWAELEDRLQTLQERFNVPSNTPTVSELQSRGVTGFELIDVRHVEATEDGDISFGDRPTTIPRGSSDSGSELRQLLISALTLLMVAAAIAFCSPYLAMIQDLVNNPITWLAVLGLCCLIVAPPPVAIALIGVAVCFAVFPND